MFIRYATKETHARIDCDKIAACKDRRIMVLSCSGPQQTLRGLAALLVSDAKVQLEWFNDDDEGKSRLERDGCGYKCYKHLLCPGIWHFVWISKDPRLLVAGKEAIGQALWSETYTTPLLKAWIEPVRDALIEEGLLVELDGAGCESAYLTAEAADLDRIVTNGVREGRLKIA
jgi:hypothetical protein